MVSKYCETVLIKTRENDEEIEKPMQILWDKVPLNLYKVGHLEILCVKWRKNAALAEHCTGNTHIYWHRAKLATIAIQDPTFLKLYMF